MAESESNLGAFHTGTATLFGRRNILEQKLTIFAWFVPEMEIEENSNGGKAEEQELPMPMDDMAPMNTMGSLPLIYAVEDRPSWGLSVLLGLQHYLTMVGGIISLPFLLAPFLCILPDDPTRGYLISTIFMVSGVATIFQTMFGVRLPIVQGTSLAYLTCTLAILHLPQWKCPPSGDLYAMGYFNRTEEWQLRMREIQGAIIGASVLEVLIGYCGLIGVLLKYITPLTIAPTITLVGLSLVSHGADLSSGNWYISGLTVILVTLFSQYLRRYITKVPVYTLTKGWYVAKFKGFQLLPVLITTVIIYVTCAVLTRYDVFPPEDPGRIELKTSILVNADWFIFPYPFQWGWPTFQFSSILAMFAAVISGVVESVGDYYACAKICGKPPPPKTAMNRGIGIEGIGCIFAGAMGIGTGVTSLSENIGAIGVTRVGSRIVVQCGAVIMICLSFSGKVGALFATIPSPVIGGFLCIMFSMVTAVGLSNLQYIDMGSPRNLFVLGSSVFFGVALPEWLKKNPHAIETGVLSIDQLVTVLLSTHMFVGGFIGFFLDNTIPGSPEERGLLAWRGKQTGDDLLQGIENETYSLPKPFSQFVKKCKHCLRNIFALKRPK